MYRAGEIIRTPGEAEAWAQGEQVLAVALGPSRSVAAQTRGEALSPVEVAEYALSICCVPAP